VKPGDILVGKITPKGETELTSEEKLLRAIFGEKARDVKDTSLRVPHGQYGKVVQVRRIARKDLKPRTKGGTSLPAGVLDLIRVWVAEKRKVTEGDKLAGRHGNKGVISKILPREDMPCLPDGSPVDIILNPIGVPSRMNLGQILETHLGKAADILGFKARTPVFSGADTETVEDYLARAWFITISESINKKDLENNKQPDYKKVYEWIKNHGFKPEKVFSDAISNKGYASKTCLAIWLQETAGINTSEVKDSDLMQNALDVQVNLGLSAPIFGKTKLRDGRTGEFFDQPVTVGNIYILKLIHLVEDKIHARSTGPYSLITQQPLGGKAQFGGQRFGEMEVWALEAYSAAHTLQEMLTVKSDDVIGRVKTYEAIVKGEQITQPGIPESFQVLLKELQGLGLSVEQISENSISGNLGRGQSDESLEKKGFENYELPDDLTTNIEIAETQVSEEKQDISLHKLLDAASDEISEEAQE
jgi:DNA-directed RNA polymerase subunit beta